MTGKPSMKKSLLVLQADRPVSEGTVCERVRHFLIMP